MEVQHHTVTTREYAYTQINSGEYGNESKVVRDLIRREQKRNAEIEAIRTALIVGVQSGLSDRTPEDVRAAVRERLRKNGQLPAE